MAKREVTFDLLTEDGKNIFTESGSSFLIVRRGWVEVEMGGGWLPDPNYHERYQPRNDLPKTIRIVIKHGDRKWERVYDLTNHLHAVKIITMLRNIKDKMQDVKVLAFLNKVYNKTISVIAKRK